MLEALRLKALKELSTIGWVIVVELAIVIVVLVRLSVILVLVNR